MDIQEIHFREALNRVVFLDKPNYIRDKGIQTSENENINGFYAYVFWNKNGEISLRVLDLGFGDEEYFETFDTYIDFEKEKVVLNYNDIQDGNIRIFQSSVVEDNPKYFRIIKETEELNCIQEGLLEARKNMDIDIFREEFNKDVVKFLFSRNDLMFKSKAKVRIHSLRGEIIHGKLEETPFGGFKNKKGDMVSGRIKKLEDGEKKIVAINP